MVGDPCGSCTTLDASRGTSLYGWLGSSLAPLCSDYQPDVGGYGRVPVGSSPTPATPVDRQVRRDSIPSTNEAVPPFQQGKSVQLVEVREGYDSHPSPFMPQTGMGQLLLP